MNELIKQEYVEIIKKIILLLRNQKLIIFEVLRIKSNLQIEEYIHQKAMQKIHKYQDHEDNEVNHSIIITSLSLIAFDYYNGDFWGHVKQKYQPLYSASNMSDEWMDSKIREIIGKMMPDDISSTRKISFILWQTIVPLNYLNDFYNILFVVFLNDLRRSLPDDPLILEGLLKTIFQQISKRTNQDTDSIKSSIMNQAYKFIQSTRDVIHHHRYRPFLAKYSRFIIQSIALEINYAKHFDDIPQYLQEIGHAWFEKQGEKKLDYFLKQTSTKSTTQKISWKIDYSFENQNLILTTKTLFLPPDIDYKSIYIEVLSDNNQVYINRTPRIIDNDLSIELESLEVKVNFSPFNIIVRVHGIDVPDEVIKTDYLLFDLSGNRISYNNKSNQDLFVLAKDLSSSNTTLIKKTPFFHVGYLDTNKEESLVIKDKIYTFKKYHRSELNGKKITQGYFDINFKKIEIFTKDVILIHPKIQNQNKVVLWVNGKCRDIEYSDSLDDMVIKMDFLDLGINVIELKNNENKTIPNAHWDIFFDPGFSFYFDTDNKKYIISSSIFDKIEDFFDPHIDEHIEVFRKADQVPMKLIYHPYEPMISTQNQKFIPINEYLWYEDFGYYDEVTIKGIDADTLQFQTDSKIQVGPVISVLYGELGAHFKFIIGFLKTNHSDQNINLTFSKNNDLVFQIPFLNFNKLNRNNFEITVNNQRNSLNIYIDQFLGKNKMDIHLYQNESLIEKIKFDKAPFEKIFEHIIGPFQYQFRIMESNTVILKKNIYYYRKEDLVNKIFKISDITYFATQKVTKEYWESKIGYDQLRNSYVTIKSYDPKSDLYTGQMLFKKYDTSFVPFRNVKEVIIDFYQGIENQSKIPAIILTADDYETMFFDVRKHYILDTTLEPKTELIATIDDYILNMEENI